MQFSFLYIQTLHNYCSHIKDVRLPFCAHFINIFFIFFFIYLFFFLVGGGGVLNLDILFHSNCLGGVWFVKNVFPTVFIP